jgi:hypothetical protein
VDAGGVVGEGDVVAGVADFDVAAVTRRWRRRAAPEASEGCQLNTARIGSRSAGVRLGRLERGDLPTCWSQRHHRDRARLPTSAEARDPDWSNGDGRAIRAKVRRCLGSQCTAMNRQQKQIPGHGGGPKWTSTTDLCLIRAFRPVELERASQDRRSWSVTKPCVVFHPFTLFLGFVSPARPSGDLVQWRIDMHCCRRRLGGRLSAWQSTM